MEEFSISITEKTQEYVNNQDQLKTRHVVRLDFWKKLLLEMNSKSGLFPNISPSKYGWIGAGAGVRGVAFNFAGSKDYARCELYIDRGDHEENKFVYDELLSKQETIEEGFGGALSW